MLSAPNCESCIQPICRKHLMRFQKMKAKFLSIFLLCFASALSAGEIDPRFDGKWVGSEKFSYRAGGNTITAPSPVIGIAEHGKLLGVLSGWVAGRYEVSPESRGNRLVYRMPGRKESSSPGRQ